MGTAGSDVVAVDPTSGALGGRVHVDGLADFADGGSADGLVVAPSAITDPTAEAKVLAGITGLDAATLENRLRAVANQGGETPTAVLGADRANGQ